MGVTITFYLGKITKFSPIYLIYFLLLLFGAALLLKRKRFSMQMDQLPIALLALYVLVTQVGNYYDGSFVNILIGSLAYLTVRGLKADLDACSTAEIVFKMSWVSAAVLTVDSLYRLTHPGAPAGLAVQAMSDSFYAYKYNSLLFSDSNTTGLIALILYFALSHVELYSKKNDFDLGRKFGLVKLVLALLIFGSLSRAAIGVFLICGLFSLLRARGLIFGATVSIALALALVSYGLYMERYLLSDLSLGTKFSLIELVADRTAEASWWEVAFGHGLGNSVEYLGRDPHLLFLTYFFEMGAVGLCLLLAFMAIYARQFGFVVLFPVLLVSLSYFLYAGAPFLFLPLALVANYRDGLRLIERTAA